MHWRQFLAEQYPMDVHFGGVFSGIVTFFRGPESKDSALDEKPYNIPVISVAAIAEGTSTVTASAGGKTATCTITVSKGTVDATSIVLNKTTLSLNKGESETLVVSIEPSDATDKTVSWISSDSSVASVDSNGKVTAIANGIASIIAKTGRIQATCEQYGKRTRIRLHSHQSKFQGRHRQDWSDLRNC